MFQAELQRNVYKIMHKFPFDTCLGLQNYVQCKCVVALVKHWKKQLQNVLCITLKQMSFKGDLIGLLGFKKD